MTIKAAIRFAQTLLLWPILWWGYSAALYCAEPDQPARWNAARLRPQWSITADKAVNLFLRTRDAYDRLGQAHANGVPAPIIFGFHLRESDNSFRCHLHEGSPLTHRTRDVPKNRPVTWNPPNDWFTSALDALYDYEHLERRDWQHPQSALQAAESYNGLGYQRRGIPSPYLWSGTTIYARGKFVADGRFSDTAVDQQLGLAAIFLRMRDRGIPLPAALAPPRAVPLPPLAREPPAAPTAADAWDWLLRTLRLLFTPPPESRLKITF